MQCDLLNFQIGKNVCVMHIWIAITFLLQDSSFIAYSTVERYRYLHKEF